MRISVQHSIDGLARDCTTIVRQVKPDAIKVVQQGVRAGEREARMLARRSAGTHGKHYPNAITSEIKSAAFGAIVGEWGPDVSRSQGGMSFEWGSRNQPPHNDIGRSRDLVAPAFYGAVRDLPGQWFWP